MKATLKKINYEIGDGYQILLETEELDSNLEELIGKEVTIDISKYYKKRTLQSNAFAWELIGKLAQKLRDTSMNVYRKYIREMGIFNYLAIKEECVDQFEKAWTRGHSGRLVEREPSKLKGCINVRAYLGSSDFNTEQMSRFIDAIKLDCEEQGIPIPITEDDSRQIMI